MYCLIRCYNEKSEKLNKVVVELFKYVKEGNDNEMMRNVIDSVYQCEQSNDSSNNNNASNIKMKIEHIMNIINN